MLKNKQYLPILFTLILVVGFFFLTGNLHAQEAAAAGDAAKPEAQAPVTFFSIFIDFKNHAAKACVMWMLLLMSVVMMTFIIEMIIKLRTNKLAPPAVVALLKDAIGQGNYQGAWEICKANPCFLSKIFAPAVENFGLGKHAVDEAIGEAFARESSRLKAHNSYLSVIGVVSPMIGLTGTVWGMIGAFKALGDNGIANPSLLAGKIGEVLVATMSGLVVAVPAFIFFYVLRARAQRGFGLGEPAVALPDDRFQGIGRRAQFAPQPLHMHIYRPCPGALRVLPDRAQQRLPADAAPRVLGEH